MPTTRLRAQHQVTLRELLYRSRQAVVATKRILGISRRGDAKFFLDRFDRALRSGRLGRDIRIMATGKNDGAGSQAQAAMSALCFARAHALPYVHRPFTTIMHAETDMPLWVRMCEDYFNLGAGERHLEDDGATVLAIEDIGRASRNGPLIVAAEHYLHYCNRDAEAWERVLPELRRKYWLNKNRGSKSGAIRVAVHMRRGDVSAADRKVANNFTPNATFVNTLTRLKALLPGRTPALRIEIFSQGDPSMFADLTALGAELRLDEPALDTHRALVESDILVMSKGAYSYTAGVLHEGITLYDPQKYRPLKDWVVRGPDGSFDEATVSRRLKALLAQV